MQQTTSPDTGSSRVFVVDDEWMIAESLAAILDRHGFRSQAFHNPGQALVRALDRPPDVLITDVMMPGMNGIELALSLRRAGHDCRILLVSGQSAARDMLRGARREGYDFELLDKPVNPMQLLLRLHHARHSAKDRPLRARERTADATARPRPAA